MNPPDPGPSPFPGPFGPIPPASGYVGGPPGGPGGSPAGGPPFNPPSGRVSLGAISEAWELLQANMGAWIGATLIYFVLSSVLQRAGGGGTYNPQTGLGSIITPSFVTTVMISSLVRAVLTLGLAKMALETVRTGKADLNQIGNFGYAFLPLLLAVIVMAIAEAVGLVLCILPAIYLGVAFTMVKFIILEGQTDPIEALKQSEAAIRPYWFDMFLVVIVCGLISIAGFLACCVGELIAFPLVTLTSAVIYKDLFGLRPAAESPIYPASPIADPNG